ncbi:MAG: polysaccharide deacetylase family protein [Desulfitobacterium hafniense]|nr:polysaccharide deacetylase family protein [Desulfitobacterium hafniense]
MKSKFSLVYLLLLFFTLLVLSGCGIKSVTKDQNKIGSEKEQSSSITQLSEPIEKKPITTQPVRQETQVIFPENPKITAIPVLYYHSIAVEKGNELRIPPDQFESQMNYLHSNGYSTISMDQFYEFMNGTKRLPDKPILITFDDGYQDNYSNAYPILKKYGFTATVFMVSNFVNGSGFMNSTELKELIANGWNIEGHTANHLDLSTLTGASMSPEISEAKNKLEQITGKEVKYFAYPYGKYNDEIIKSLKLAGYKMAFSTERGWAKDGRNIMLVNRVYCYTDMGMNEFVRRLQNPSY